MRLFFILSTTISAAVCMAACSGNHTPPSPVITIADVDGRSIMIGESDEAGKVKKICDALAPVGTGGHISVLRQQCDAVVAMKNQDEKIIAAQAEIAQQEEFRQMRLLGRLCVIVIIMAMAYATYDAFKRGIL